MYFILIRLFLLMLIIDHLLSTFILLFKIMFTITNIVIVILVIRFLFHLPKKYDNPI